MKSNGFGILYTLLVIKAAVCLTVYHTILRNKALENTILRNKAFENNVGKGENAGNQDFLLFPHCFQTLPKRILIFQSHLFSCLQMLSIWKSKNLSFDKELTLHQATNF